jgi:8-amino-7-oxononanoate synthase
MRPHVQLERELAAFLHKEAALVLPSGWMANEAVIRTIPQKGDMVLLDKLDHASIIDAARGSEAEFRTFRRDNLGRLEKFLAEPKYNRKFIVTESVFSMDGDRADLRELVRLKESFDAILIVDEAHAFGCLGETGAGLAEELGVLDGVDIVVATMSKALGATGGVVAAGQCVIDLLVNKARSFIYTTAPSPVNCEAVLAALEIVRREPDRRKRLRSNAKLLRDSLRAMGLDTGRSDTHIIPVIIGAEKDTLAAAAHLYDGGFFVVGIRPPTVSPGTARLRISVQAEHSRSQIDGLCSALRQLMENGLLPSAKAGQT